MIYAKHPTLGNAHFPLEKREELVAAGWVIWRPQHLRSAPPAQPPEVFSSPRSASEPVAPPKKFKGKR